MEQSHLLLKKWQKRILFTLWLTYAFMYFGRVNMSVAIPFIEERFGWSTATVGTISGVFFWVYAIGQLVNGILGDRLSARWFVFVGLVGTALMNLLFGLGGSFFPMLLFWGFNGVFQSMGWGPILKTASNWTFSQERSKIAGFLSTSFVLGSLFTWYILGYLLDATGRWRLVFTVPATVLFFLALVWLVIIRDHPSQAGLRIQEEAFQGNEVFRSREKLTNRTNDFPGWGKSY